MLSVLRRTLFHPSSQKRGLERFLSRAKLQSLGIEVRVSNSCFCRILKKQTGVKASTFDVIESLNAIPSLQEVHQHKPHKHIFSTETL